MAIDLASTLRRALALHQAGDVRQAVELYETALRADANNPVALNYLGVARMQAGRLDEAAELIEQSLVHQPEYVAALNNLGTVRQQQQRFVDAVATYEQVLRLDPENAVAEHNRANGLLELGKHQLAKEGFQRALQLRPGYPAALGGLSTAQRRLAYFADAIETAHQAVQLDASSVDHWNRYGLALRDGGQAELALTTFQRALEQNDQHVAARINLATVYVTHDRLAEATEIVDDLVNQCPHDADVLQLRAEVARAAGDPESALIDYERALAMAPRSAELWFGLAQVQRGLGMLDEAVKSLQTAIEHCPEDVRYLNSLANVLRDQGHPDEALRVYELSLQLNADNPATVWNLAALRQRQLELTEAHASFDDLEPLLVTRKLDSQLLWCRLRKACLAPLVVQTIDEIHVYRAHLTEQLARVVDVGCTNTDQVDRYAAFPPLALLHHGLCNRSLKTEFAGRFEAHFARQPVATGQQRKVPRVGFVVSRGHEAVFLRCMRGMIDQLDTNVMEVFVIGSHAARRRFARKFESPHLQIVPVSDAFRPLARTIAELDLDLLYHWEVGTDATNYFLPMMQLARVQVTGWGVPDTTGMKAIDFYLSSSLVEPDEGQSNYSERVLLARELLTYQEPLAELAAGGESAGALKPTFDPSVDRSTSARYLCVQNLGKLHPDNDLLWAKILRRDSAATLTLFRDRGGRAAAQLQLRWQQSIPDVADRIRFLEPLPYEQFLACVRSYDVLLDTLHCGGGLTTYDTLAMGKVIVTFPGRFARGRYTAACYLRMGLGELVATSHEDYVENAIRFAADGGLRSNTEQRIRAASSLLFRQKRAVDEFQRLLLTAIDG